MYNILRKILNSISGVILILFLTFSFSCQTKQKMTDDNSVSQEAGVQSENWFTVKKLSEKVWRIDDHGGDNIYLVEGNEKALLIDTGTGAANLAACVKSITEKPLLVVNTHGHPDHAGGNFQFDEVYAHPLDYELIGLFNNKQFHENTLKKALQESPGLELDILKDSGDFKAAELIPIKEGYVFDLGGRKLEVIETPGHTKGSICLLDAANKLVFTGDNNNTLVWLFLQGCLPLDSYLETLKKLNLRTGEFETMLPGHGGPLDKTFINEQIICAQSILDGSCTGAPYESFAGNALLCSHKRAAIAFDPDNLFAGE